MSSLGRIINSVPEIQELRNCLNVSVNRFIFTPRPTSYDFIDFVPPNDLTPDQKEKLKSKNEKTIKEKFPFAELVFIPISIERGFRYDLPCIWISSASKNKNKENMKTTTAKRYPTLLYFHGSAGTIGSYFEDLDHIVENVKKQLAAKTTKSSTTESATGSRAHDDHDQDSEIEFDILLVEYPGYGLASPFLSRAGAIRNDQDRVKDYEQQLIPTDFLFTSNGCLFHPNPDKLRVIGQKVLEFVLKRRVEASSLRTSVEEVQFGVKTTTTSTTTKTKMGSESRINNNENENSNNNLINNREIILMARSLGTGLALELATNPLFSSHIHSVILLSPYTSIPRVIKEVACDKIGNFLGSNIASPVINLCLKLSNSEFFRSEENIRKLDRDIPCLIIHGEMDFFISKQHSIDLVLATADVQQQPSEEKKIMKKNNVELLFDPVGDHVTLDYHKKVIDFLFKYLKSEKAPSSSSTLITRSEPLVPASLVASTKQQLTVRKARFIQENKDAGELKSKALNTLRFVLLMSIIISVSVSYVSVFGVPFFGNGGADDVLVEEIQA